jgi:protein SCO1
MKHEPRTYRTTVARMLLGAAVLAAGQAGVFAQDTEASSNPVFDPISFRGPDPKKQFDEIFIDQKLNQQVPLDLEFVNEQGETVKLADYFGNKPVVLGLVYYECPMLCNMIMNGMAASFDAKENKLDIGKDYTVLTVSIDPEETHELAVAKKKNYMKQMHRPEAEEGWQFLTGTQSNIEDLAHAVGFRYYYDERSGEYAHASGIIILTSDGRVSSYYLGIEYLPQKLELALVDAGRGAIGSLADRLILLCYMYDPARGYYGLYIYRMLYLGAGGVVLAVLGFWGAHFVQVRRHSRHLTKSPGRA